MMTRNTLQYTILEFLSKRTTSVSRTEISRECFQGHASRTRIDDAIEELLSAAPPEILVEKATSPQFIEVAAPTTVQDVLDNIYFMLNGEVEPRTYLEQWVLRDLTNGDHLIVREIQYRIPAGVLFTPGSKWEVVKLTKPYTATDRLATLSGNPSSQRK